MPVLFTDSPFCTVACYYQSDAGVDLRQTVSAAADTPLVQQKDHIYYVVSLLVAVDRLLDKLQAACLCPPG
jgi:hypothetical protein